MKIKRKIKINKQSFLEKFYDKNKEDILFIAYSIIGLFVDVGLYHFLVDDVSMKVIFANIISYPTGILVTFLFNYKLNYNNQNYALLRLFITIFAHGFSLLVQSVSIHLFCATKIVTIVENAILMWFTRKLIYKNYLVIPIIKVWSFIRKIFAPHHGLVSDLVGAF